MNRRDLDPSATAQRAPTRLRAEAAIRHGVTGVVLGLVMGSNAAADGAAIAQKGAGGAAACASCHGADGRGVVQAGFPRLAGVGQAYLQRQLDAFADGSRVSPVMMPIAKALSDADRAAVSKHYAAMPFAAATAAAAAASPPLARASAAAAGSATSIAPGARPASGAAAQRAPLSGAELATRGRWEDKLPACDQCHGPAGRGVGADFPPLAGQSATYLAAQLTAFKTGARPPGPLRLMAVVAAQLSEAEMRAVAEHYESTAGRAAR